MVKKECVRKAVDDVEQQSVSCSERLTIEDIGDRNGHIEKKELHTSAMTRISDGQLHRWTAFQDKGVVFDRDQWFSNFFTFKNLSLQVSPND